MSRRVVITGAGVVSALGNSVDTFIENIKDGKNGISLIEGIDVGQNKVKLAAEVKDFDPKDFDIDGHKKKDKFVQYAMAAAKQAYESSGFEINDENRFRTGVVIGSGIGGLVTIQDAKYLEKGPRKVSSHFIPKAIINMASAHVSIKLGTRGVCTSSVTACATATDSIGSAFRLIKDGYQDAIFAGGCEASICELGVSGFEAMSALTVSQDVNRASIPFDKERSGFVMGEGAGVLLLESLESALDRKANIICEIVGYGQTSDAYHITAPDPSGVAGIKAIEMALEMANLNPDEVDYINAHGTSTILNDKAECLIYNQIFGNNQIKPLLGSIKANIGHLLGAAGAIEALATTLSIYHNSYIPQIGTEELDEDCLLELATKNHKRNLNHAITNNLGFGGHNTTLVISKVMN